MYFPKHTHTHYTVYTAVLIARPLSSPTIPHPPLSTTQGGGRGWTVLMNAAESGHVEAVKALVAADPDPAHLNMRVSIP